MQGVGEGGCLLSDRISWFRKIISRLLDSRMAHIVRHIECIFVQMHFSVGVHPAHYNHCTSPPSKGFPALRNSYEWRHWPYHTYKTAYPSHSSQSYSNNVTYTISELSDHPWRKMYCFPFYERPSYAFYPLPPPPSHQKFPANVIYMDTSPTQPSEDSQPYAIREHHTTYIHPPTQPSNGSQPYAVCVWEWPPPHTERSTHPDQCREPAVQTDRQTEPDVRKTL